MPPGIYSALDTFLLSAFATAWTLHKMAAIEVSNPKFEWITTNTKGTQVPSPWVRILISRRRYWRVSATGWG